jgi:hypothetical protein
MYADVPEIHIKGRGASSSFPVLWACRIACLYNPPFTYSCHFDPEYEGRLVMQKWQHDQLFYMVPVPNNGTNKLAVTTEL